MKKKDKVKVYVKPGISEMLREFYLECAQKFIRMNNYKRKPKPERFGREFDKIIEKHSERINKSYGAISEMKYSLDISGFMKDGWKFVK